MKFTLKRSSACKVENSSDWKIQEVSLEGEELIESLRYNLSNVMEGILDPDIAGKQPDGFLNVLQSGRLGDFSKRYIITAHDKGKVIGLLIGLPEENNKLHIYSMGVIKTYRNMQVGHVLLSRCINDMLQRNINEIVLDVHSDNIPAYNLYKKFGFM